MGKSNEATKKEPQFDAITNRNTRGFSDLMIAFLGTIRAGCCWTKLAISCWPLQTLNYLFMKGQWCSRDVRIFSPQNNWTRIHCCARFRNGKWLCLAELSSRIMNDPRTKTTEEPTVVYIRDKTAPGGGGSDQISVGSRGARWWVHKHLPSPKLLNFEVGNWSPLALQNKNYLPNVFGPLTKTKPLRNRRVFWFIICMCAHPLSDRGRGWG